MNTACIVALKNDRLSQVQLLHMLHRRGYEVVRLLFEKSEILQAAMVVATDNPDLLMRRLESLPCVEAVLAAEDEAAGGNDLIDVTSVTETGVV